MSMILLLQVRRLTPDTEAMAATSAAPRSISDSIGRILTSLQVSAYIPAVLLVAGMAVLRAVDNGDRPDRSLPEALDVLSQVGLGGAAVAIGLIFAMAVVIEPLQFSAIRLVEGYWGNGWLRQRIRRVLVAYQVSRFDDLQKQRRELAAGVDAANKWQVSRERDLEVLRHRLNHLPTRANLMPLPLGNRLRSWEDKASADSEARIELLVPRHFHAMPDEVRRQHDYYRSSLDLHCTLIAVWLVLAVYAAATLEAALGGVLTVFALFAAVPLTHRAAMVAADGYGEQLMTIRALIDAAKGSEMAAVASAQANVSPRSSDPAALSPN